MTTSKEIWAIVKVASGEVVFSRGGSSTKSRLMVYDNQRGAEIALRSDWTKQVIKDPSEVEIRRIYPPVENDIGDTTFNSILNKYKCHSFDLELEILRHMERLYIRWRNTHDARRAHKMLLELKEHMENVPTSYGYGSGDSGFIKGAMLEALDTKLKEFGPKKKNNP